MKAEKKKSASDLEALQQKQASEREAMRSSMEGEESARVRQIEVWVGGWVGGGS